MTPRTASRRVLLLFIDGVGVGPQDPDLNPLATGDYPTLRLAEGLTPQSPVGPPSMAWGLDASLGVPGLPQSATGQTAILTGVNAPEALGRHVSGFPGPVLRRILLEHSVLKRIRSRGGSAVFLNAFRPEYFQHPEAHRRLSATSIATLASGAPFRNWEDLASGRAVTHDLTHWRMRERGYELPDRSPEEAGEIIANESARHDFSLFEYFETDRAGHAQDRDGLERCLRDLDRAIGTVLRRVDLDRTTVVVASDHGNIEDGSVKTHTSNPAFFAAWKSAGQPDSPGGSPTPRRLTDLVPFILGEIGATSTA